MEFQEAVRVCFAKYVDFEGEASRSEFWWFFLFTGVVSFALAVVSNKLSGLFSLAVWCLHRRHRPQASRL